jgi:hypothetical protein
MEKSRGCLVSVFWMAAIMYLLASFTEMSFYPQDWDIAARIVVALFLSALLFILFIFNKIVD